MTDITLDYPITINGAQVTRIRLRRPKTRDTLIARKMKGDSAEQEIALIANLSELSPEDVQELDVADYRKVQQALEAFFG